MSQFHQEPYGSFQQDPDNGAFEVAGITSLAGLTAKDLAPVLTIHTIGSMKRFHNVYVNFSNINSQQSLFSKFLNTITTEKP